MRRPPDPFDLLAPDLQDQVRATAHQLNGVLRGPFDESAPGGTQHSDARHLAVELHAALTGDHRVLSSSQQVRTKRDHIEAVRQTLDEFTTNARQNLDAALSLLDGLAETVAADERRRSTESLAEERRRKLDREVDRLVAAEEATAERERRRRLEEHARSRLEAAG